MSLKSQTYISLFVFIREGQPARETLGEHLQPPSLHGLHQPIHWHPTAEKQQVTLDGEIKEETFKTLSNTEHHTSN